MKAKKIISQFKINKEEFSLLTTNSQFKLLFLSNVITMIGGQMHRFGLPWIVYSLTGSGSLMAINFIISFIPGLIFSSVGGVLSDRYNRKIIMTTCNLLSSILIIILFLSITFYENLTIYHIFLIAFILSTIGAISAPSFRSILPSIVNKDEYIRANSLFTVAQSIILLMGPAFSGVVIGLAGAEVNILINGLAFLLSFIMLSMLNYNSLNIVADNSSKGLDYYLYGFRYLKQDKFIYTGMIVSIGVLISSGSIGSLLQYHLIENLSLSGFTFAASFIIFEFIPAFLIGLYAKNITKLVGQKKSIIMGSFVFCFSLFLFSLTNIYIIVVTFAILINACSALISINWVSMVQTRVDSNKLGRVNGAINTIQSSLIPIGGLLSAYLVTFLSANYIFSIFSLIGLCICFLALYLVKFYGINLNDDQNDDFLNENSVETKNEMI